MHYMFLKENAFFNYLKSKLKADTNKSWKRHKHMQNISTNKLTLSKSRQHPMTTKIICMCFLVISVGKFEHDIVML